MKTRSIAIVALALSLGGLAMQDRVASASRVRAVYEALHEEQPELNAVQRLLVSLALAGSDRT
jgi:hypothetical protein